jgi:hypothetical protein
MISAHEDVVVKCHAGSRGSVKCHVFRVLFWEACEDRGTSSCEHHLSLHFTSINSVKDHQETLTIAMNKYIFVLLCAWSKKGGVSAV